MKFDKFTLKTQEALATAQQTAMAKSNTVLSPLHLLSAIVSDDEGIGPEILKKIGANVGRIKDMTESEMHRLAAGQDKRTTYARPGVQPDCFRCAEYSGLDGR